MDVREQTPDAEGLRLVEQPNLEIRGDALPASRPEGEQVLHLSRPLVQRRIHPGPPREGPEYWVVPLREEPLDAHGTGLALPDERLAQPDVPEPKPGDELVLLPVLMCAQPGDGLVIDRAQHDFGGSRRQIVEIDPIADPAAHLHVAGEPPPHPLGRPQRRPARPVPLAKGSAVGAQPVGFVEVHVPFSVPSRVDG